MFVAQLHLVTGEVRRALQRLLQRQDEHFPLELAHHVDHGVVLDDAAFVDDGDVAAEALRLVKVVGSEDDSHAVFIDPGHEVPHGSADLDVHPGGGFIQNQQPGLVDQRPGDHQAALHAAGQRSGQFVAAVPEVQGLQVFLRPPLGLGARNAVIAGLVDQNVPALLEHVDVDFLGNHADAGLGGLPLAVQVVTEYRYVAGGLVDQRGDDSDGGGLARAIGTQQREKVALPHGQVDAPKRFDAARIRLAKLSQLKRVQVPNLPL